MSDWLMREEALLGKDAVDALQNSCAAVFGIGGVGGHAAEALCRAGVGKLVLIDAEKFDLTNCNRQIFATRETVGMLKTEAAAVRLRAISPEVALRTYPLFFTRESAPEELFNGVDIILDAMDTLRAKLDLIELAAEKNIPLISCMGTGNKLDPTAFRIGDLYDTRNCPLARRMRKECRKRGIDRLRVVYSEEEAPKIVASESAGRHVPGSISFVPGAAGLCMAGEAVRQLLLIKSKTRKEEEL